MFISLEGIDGAGKSTWVPRIVDKLRDAGKDVVCTREPGGTPVGEKLREILLSSTMSCLSEALITYAARNEHLINVIRPAISAGKWVVTDRFIDSTYAFQVCGRDLNYGTFRTLDNMVLSGRDYPNHILYFDCPVEVASKRMQGKDLDVFETREQEFHSRVREAYLDRAVNNPRYFIIDSSRSTDDVGYEVDAIIDLLLRRDEERIARANQKAV